MGASEVLRRWGRKAGGKTLKPKYLIHLFFYVSLINLEAGKIILPFPNHASENNSLDSITLRKDTITNA